MTRKYKRQCQQARANLMKLIEADREAEAEREMNPGPYDALITV